MDTPSLTAGHGKKALLDAVRGYRKAHEREIVDELIGWLSIPNIEADRAEM